MGKVQDPVFLPKVGETVKLWYKDGRSDKIYDATIRETSPGKFAVEYAYGRRGSALNTGYKIDGTTYENACKVIEKMLTEKMAKGYQLVSAPSGQAAPAAATKHVNPKAMNILPQLLNEVPADKLDALIKDSNWGMQEKKDGKRIMIKREADADPVAINRRGLSCAVPDEVLASLKYLDLETYLIDGELVGTIYWVFDVLEGDGTDLREQGYGRRHTVLCAVMPDDQIHLQLVPLASTIATKKKMFTDLESNGCEGAVLKKLDAPYVAGRPNSLGNHLKFKFYASCSVIVKELNEKRSFAAQVCSENGKELTNIGNVTVPPNWEMPQPGDVVEVQYLYAYRGGSLYQPVYKGPRDDIDPSQCMISQLKYKQEIPGGDDEA